VADLLDGVDERPFLCADPVRIGRVGESPGDSWEQAVAQVGRRFDLARVERVSLGTDGEAQYVNGASRIPFREVDGWIDPFHVIRAAASCAVDRGVGGRAVADALRRSGPEAAAGLIEGMAGRGGCREGARGVAAYLRRHAGRIGGRAVDGHDGGRAAARLQGPHGVVPVRLAARGGRRDGEGAQLAALRFRPAAQDEGGVPLRGEGASRDGRLVSSLPGSRVRSEGKGWEYPLAGSVAALGSDVRFRAFGGGL